MSDRRPFEARASDGDQRKLYVRLDGADGCAERTMTGDEARAFSVELAQVANNVDPPAPLEPRTHHYAAQMDDDGTRLHVYEEADGLPTEARARPTGMLTRLCASNVELSTYDLRRMAQARFAFLEILVHRRDGRVDRRLG